MAKYNPEKHHRRSIRLKGYDYSQAGMYFITMCVQNRECLFGEVIDGEMILNDAGKMIEKWYRELPNKFSDIESGEYIVMPNHFHCIIINNGSNAAAVDVGADPRVCPNVEEIIKKEIAIEMGGEHVGSPQPGSPQPGSLQSGSPLYRVIQWFKTMTTNEYIRGVKTLDWTPFNKKVWQRDYYEHIIRNDIAYHNITNYIINNPAKWTGDTFN